MAVRETVDARKLRIGEDDLERVFRGAEQLIVSRGARAIELDLRRGQVAKAELAAAVLGPSGNLRAPAARIGSTWLVGFDETIWNAHL